MLLINKIEKTEKTEHLNFISIERIDKGNSISSIILDYLLENIKGYFTLTTLLEILRNLKFNILGYDIYLDITYNLIDDKVEIFVDIIFEKNKYKLCNIYGNIEN